MKTKFILIYFLLSTVLIQAQPNTIDSLNIAQLIEEGDSLSKIKEHDSALVVYDSVRLILLTEENWKDYFSVVKSMLHQYSSKREGTKFDFVEEQIKLAEEKIPNEHEVIGYFYFQQGNISYHNRDTKNAVIAYKAALNKYKKVLEDDDLKIIRTYKKLGFIYSEIGKWEKAKSYLDLCLQTNIAKKDTSFLYQKDLAETYLAQAVMNKELIQYEKAIEYHKKALNIYQSIQDTIHIGIVHYNMGFAYQLDKQIDNSLIHLHRSNEIFIEFFGEKHHFVAASYNLLAVSYRFVNKEEEIRYYEKSLEITSQLYQEEHVRTAIVMTNLASALVRQNKEKIALNYAERANAIFEKSLPKYHPLKAGSISTLSVHYSDYAYSFDNATKYLELFFDQIKNLYGENYHELNTYYNGKSKIAFVEKDYEQAIIHAKESLKINSWEIPNDTNKQKIPIQNRYIDLTAAITAHRSLANSYFEIWQKNPKNIQYIDSSFIDLENCHIISQQVSHVEVTDTYSLKNHILNAMNYMSEIYALDNTRASYFNQFFNWSERFKGQKIVQSITDADAKAASNISEEYLIRELSLSNQIFRKEQEVLAALENKDSLVSNIRTEMFDLRVKKKNLTEQIEKEYPDYYSMKIGAKPYTVKKVSSLLSDNELLINFTFDEEGKFSYLSGIDKEQRFLNKTSFDAEVFDKIKAFNKLLRSPTLFRTDKREKFIKLSNELYQQFIMPIEPYLAGKEKLVIIGDGMTHYLPFEVLLKNKDIKPFHELDYLVNTYQISYHYSSTLFAQAREKEISTAEGILAFAPVFSNELSLTYAPESTFPSDSDSLSMTYRAVDKDGNFVPLIYSLKEVKQLVKLVNKSSKQKSDLLLFDEANEQNLKITLEKPHRFVHIASHSFANLRESQFSGIACAPPADSTATEDGTLYVGEVYNLDIPADLVVLSSCESGLGNCKRAKV